MSTISYVNGNRVEYIDGEWRYTDNPSITFDPTKLNDVIYTNTRYCPRCSKYPNKQGHDFCIQNLGNVIAACCGHGESGYIMFDNGITIYGKFEVEYWYKAKWEANNNLGG